MDKISLTKDEAHALLAMSQASQSPLKKFFEKNLKRIYDSDKFELILCIEICEILQNLCQDRFLTIGLQSNSEPNEIGLIYDSLVYKFAIKTQQFVEKNNL